jgi:DnaJ-class molecular chaperone
MKVTIGDRTKEAMAILKIQEFPFSEKLLKKNFRIILDHFHPDKNKGKGSHEKTVEAINAYKVLKNLALESIDSSKAKKKMKSDELFSMWVKCMSCYGTGRVTHRRFVGYRRVGLFSSESVHETVLVQCRKCKGLGEYELDLNNPVIPKGAILV